MTDRDRWPDRPRLVPRRTLLGAGVGIGSLWAAGCVPTPTYPPQSGQPFEGVGTFPGGIGSADPTPTSVLLWTRVHPEFDRGEGIAVRVEVATSPAFADRSVVVAREVRAVAERDYCVTVDATGLRPGTTYWYRFASAGATSSLGRTRTAPAPGASGEAVRVAAFSCQRWTHGYYTAHADLAARADHPDTDVDLVVCLGDYVYETGYADRVYVHGRDDPIQRAVTREQFRSKYRLYRSDPNLQAMHALYPVMHIFDNHDGLSAPGDDQADGSIAAFFEHLPVRSVDGRRIWRSLRWGDIAEIFLTDQRSYRDPTLDESGPLGTSTEERPEILDPSRSMLGPEQRAWLLAGLAGSTARWKVWGSQLMFWPWRTLPRLPGQQRGAGVYLNLAQWDGYAAERLAILDHLEAHDVRDTVVFSGDSHVFSAAQVAPDVDDPGSRPRVVELGTGSITSNNADENGYPGDDVTRPLFSAANPNHLRFIETERHGYVLAEFGASSAEFEFRSPRTIHRATSEVDTLARFTVAAGTQRLRRVR